MLPPAAQHSAQGRASANRTLFLEASAEARPCSPTRSAYARAATSHSRRAERDLESRANDELVALDSRSAFGCLE